MKELEELLGNILLIAIVIFVLALFKINLNFVPCQTYITDSNHAWLEVRQSDTVITSIQLECYYK